MPADVEASSPSVSDLHRRMAEAEAENARLHAELGIASQQQTATSEVLEVINSSSGDPTRVFETILKKAHALCGVVHGSLQLFDGENFRAVALHNVPDDVAVRLRQGYKPGTYMPVRQLLEGAPFFHVHDLAEIDHPIARAAAKFVGTTLYLALRRDNRLLGQIVAAREEVRDFSDKEIALLQNFAQQAVIAMENARLLAEQREALERQTATAEVLEVINSSPGDIVPVFEAILDKAHALCGVAYGSLQLYDGEKFRAVAVHGLSQALADQLRAGYLPGPTHPVRPLLAGEDSVQIPDMAGLGGASSALRTSGLRTALFVALRKDGLLLGQIVASRDEIRPFTDKETSLLQNFAAQAVIAMENARLLGELRQRTDDLTQSLEYQTATSEVLEVIGRSTSDIQPVLDTMLASASRLCGVHMGAVSVRKGDAFRYVATIGVTERYDEYLRGTPQRIDRTTGAGRAMVTRQVAYIPDVQADSEYAMTETTTLGGFRSLLAVPLLRDDEAVGAITLARTQVEAFTDRQMALVRTFADQAVIAMENARLLSELRESLDQQTATSDVLSTISRSTVDLPTVLNTLVETVSRLCRADHAYMFRRQEGLHHLVASHNISDETKEYMRANPFRPDRGNTSGRVLLERRTVHIPDVLADPEYTYIEGQKIAGFRTMLGIPLMREDTILGVFVASRTRVEPFTDKEITLASGFADQAVIAMENARLLSELRERTDDLTESLEYQTATSELLEVISRSGSNIQPAMDTILAAAARLCGTTSGAVAVRRDAAVRVMAVMGVSAEVESALRERNHTDQSTLTGRTVLAGRVIHVDDLVADTDYSMPEIVRIAHMRTALGVPLLRDGEPIGAIVVSRNRVEPFSERQIGLIRTFAEQAVIAMENARLLTEQREALERQTATADILKVIASTRSDLQPVFEVIVDSAKRLLGGLSGALYRIVDGMLQLEAFTSLDPESDQALRRSFPVPASQYPQLALVQKGESFQFADTEEDAPEIQTRIGRLRGFRSILLTPLVHNRTTIGLVTVARAEVGPFADHHVNLMRTFADQAVIAMENARLLTEQREALERQTATAEVLQVINASPGDLAPVFEAMLEKAMRLCEVACGGLFTYDGRQFHVGAQRGVPPALAAYRDQHPPAQSNERVRQMLQTGRFVHVLDLTQTDGYRSGDTLDRSTADLGGARTILSVPLLKDSAVVGYFSVYRQEPRMFSDKQISLLENFAAQAVIAMENARLLDEIRQRQAELRVTFDNMGDGVAMFDADHRLAAWNRNFQRIMGVDEAYLAERPIYAAYLARLAEQGEFGTDNAAAGLASRLEDTERELRLERTRPDGTVIEVRRNAVPGGGIVLIYSDITERKKAEAEIVAARDAAEAALERQTATADILRVIASSPSDVQPVFAAIAERANRLIGGVATAVYRLTDGMLHLMSFTPVNPEADNALKAMFPAPLSQARTPLKDAVRTRNVFQTRDSELEFRNDPELLAVSRMRGWRSVIVVPLIHEGASIGVITVTRAEPGLVADPQVELLKTFAAQAVIAIENVRLFTELRESLEQQTATGEILRVISQSPTDVAPVLEAVVRAAVRFCGAEDITVGLREGDSWSGAAHVGPIPSSALGNRFPLVRETLMGRVMLDGQTMHAPDLQALDPLEFAGARELGERLGLRAALIAPLMREGTAIGAINLRRRTPGPFAPRQIELLEAFAAQAVIAIENVRLFTELREALEQQTATAEILQVISQSPTDVAPVLQAVAKAAVRFCSSDDMAVGLRDGNSWYSAAHVGPFSSDTGRRFPLVRDSMMGRVMIDGKTLHVPDVTQLDRVEFVGAHDFAARHGFRAALIVPMIREGAVIGALNMRRLTPGPFAPRQIELLEAFAAQAVIAIENVRLFTELREALEQQTATAEILRVISQSPTDVSPVLTAVAKAALKFCGALDAIVVLRDEDNWFTAAHEGPIEAFLRQNRRLTRGTAPGRAILDGEVVQVPDLQSAAGEEFQEGREIATRLGFRSALAAPLLRDDVAIGAISLRRREAGPFTSNQVELLRSFAAQAVIAIENVRLFTELRDSLERLKAAQANLIQAEKMASLGQLTAGIAHEIKNPLNFVNNFAGLSSELLDELKQAVEPLIAKSDDDKRAELNDTLGLLNSNLSKILEHGRRADGIVKSMLAHSRGGTGDWQTSNINGLVEEALNLAYHGARAQDQTFNVTLERDFSTALKPIDVVPQDVTRVFLNLFSNGFYATRKRQRENAEAGYQQTLTVSTRDDGEAVEIRVRDNGIGIAPDVRAKLFQPFFTTKPTGEGTGLGLSISYDIVTQQHGGSIEVESEVGQFTEFTVRLPRARRVGDRAETKR